MRHKFYVLSVCAILIIAACDRISRKGRELADQAGNKVKSRARDVAEKIFPVFDAHQADTKYNKKRFEEYLEVNVTDDVNAIYAYGDFLGADYKVLIAFTCDSSTVQKIVLRKDLKLSGSRNDDGLLLSNQFPWWDEKVIARIQPYKKIEKSGDRLYLWYDKTTRKGYFQQFSL